MVVTSAPSAWTARQVQDFTVAPSISTTQAPHWLVSQPNLGSGQPQFLTNKMDQEQAGIDLGPTGLPVDRYLNRNLRHDPLGSVD